MNPDEILAELTNPEGLPREALQAASAQRAEMLPEFLAVIEEWLGRDAAAREDPSPLFFIFHLLGEWRDKAAYRPLVRLLRCPEAAEVLGDDTISETGHRVMAAVFDGDPQPLYDIILDPQAEEFTRAAMCVALAMVTLNGELSRDQVERFLREAYRELRPQAACYVWVGWQEAIAMLGLTPLRGFVKRAFERGFISRYVLDYDDFAEKLQQGIERPGEPRHAGDDYYTVFGDTIDELSEWHCFSREEREQQGETDFDLDFDPDLEMDAPYRNPLRGIGRNDPCPCGSGKKFKKCCLA